MRWPAVLTVLAAPAGCGEGAASGPFDGDHAWDPGVRQDALAPFFVRPGDAAGDWSAGASRSPRYIPHAVDPTQGYPITANADPAGATSRWVLP